jgi:hypothetical protein
VDAKESQFEPREDGGELKGGHSPFGILYRIQKETGWTDEYLLWGIPWANVRLKLIDEMYCDYKNKSDVRGSDIDDKDELIKMLGKKNGRSG